MGNKPRLCHVCMEPVPGDYFRAELRRFLPSQDRSIGEVSATLCEECAERMAERMKEAMA